MTNHKNTQIVHIVDDDEAVRDAISLLLESVEIENQTYENAQVFLEIFAKNLGVLAPGCIVLDIRMPGMSGLECQQKLQQLGCKQPIIFITGHGDVPMAVEAIKQGAMEFIQKPFRDQELLDRIQHCLAINAEALEYNFQTQIVSQRLASLTQREKEVLDRVVEGKANKVIATDLNLSQRTIEIHRSNVMEKMQAKSLAQLIKMVIEANH